MHATVLLALVLMLAPRVIAQWRWETPVPQGNDLWNIASAPASTRIWAVGAAGTILASTDAGATWTAQESGTDEFIRGVAAPTTSIAWAVGDNGTILRTTDGGNAWVRQSSPVTAGINQIFAVSASTAWFVGDAGMLYRTTDGGATWSSQSSGVQQNLNDVCFVTATTGWCVGAAKTVIRTTDAGLSWTQQYPPGMVSSDLIGVFFLDASTGWASGTGGTIYRTTNGGASWTRSSSVGTTEDLNKVRFSGTSSGWAAGENGTLVKSTNGGVSWFPLSSGTAEGLEGLVNVGSTVVAVGVVGDIVRSYAGSAYTRITTGPRSAWNSVSCVGSSSAWVGGENGAIAATTNGGATWALQPSGTTASLFSVSALDATTVIACGGGGTLLRTTNGGASWSSVPSGTLVTLTGIDFGSASVAMAVGIGGKIVKSTDAGRTWNAIASGTFTNLYAVDMLTDRIACVVGADGLILRTDNGGASWSRQTSWTLDALFSVTLSADFGCIVGDAGTVLRTKNAGLDWENSDPGIASPIYDVVQTTAATLAIVCEDGAIMRSSDSAATWTRQVSHAQYALYAIAAAGGVVRAVGDFGMVLRNPSYPVPVRLLSLIAVREGRTVELEWRTEGESANATFLVDRFDGHYYHTIGQVPVSSAMTSQHLYRYSDPSPENDEALRYRIRQFDMDGTVGASIEVPLQTDRSPDPTLLFACMPNPVSRDALLQIAFKEEEFVAGDVNGVHLELFDLRGIRLWDGTEALVQAIRRTNGAIRTSMLSFPLQADLFPRTGAYLIRFSTPRRSVSTRIIVVK